jgi:hypothetical protein
VTAQRNLPQELRSASVRGEATSWTVDPFRVRQACVAAVRALTALPDGTPSLRLLADQTADDRLPHAAAAANAPAPGAHIAGPTPPDEERNGRPSTRLTTAFRVSASSPRCLDA